MKTTFIDNIVSFISPQAGLNRIRAKKAAEALRSYDAASRGTRRTENWKTKATSQNAESVTVLGILRDRSRDLVRNNPYAKKAVQVIANNTVGTGIRPTPIFEKETKAADKAARSIKMQWRKWAEKTDCDASGKMTFYGILSLAMRTIPESGEVLIVRRRRPTIDKIPFQLQVMEPDFLDSTKHFPPDAQGNYTFMGIEFNKYDKPIAYWLYDSHPGDIYRRAISRRIPADDVIHAYLIERPGQARGIPWGVSVFLRLKDFDDYEGAQLIRQKIAACFTAFIVNQNGDDEGDELEDKIYPGLIRKLAGGEDVKFSTPPPTEGYGEYSKNVLRAVAAGFGVTYEALTNDLSMANYSSMKIGENEFQRNVDSWQENMLIPMVCERVWEWFALGMDLMGKGVSDDVSWTAPGRMMLDPQKEVKALNEKVRAGLCSWQEAVRSQGYDPDQVLTEMAEDKAKFDELGIMPTTDPRFDTGRPIDPQPDGSQDVTQ